MSTLRLTRAESRIATLLAAFALTALATGCMNWRNRAVAVRSFTPSGPSDSSSLYQITQATVTNSAQGSTAPPQITLYFDSSRAPQPLTNVCAAYDASSSDSNSLRCQCSFSWSETNTSGASSVTVPRQVVTDVTTVQTGLLGCPAPSVYSTEIPDGTSIVIKVIPGPGNTQTFGTPTYNLVKNVNTSQGSFRDYQGRSFMNIARYSCYDSRKRGMTIQSNLQSLTNPTFNLEVRKVAMATKLCVQRIASSGVGAGSSSSDGCDTLPPADYSSQSNYYNLYIRETESGDINPSNGGYTCPMVKEPLNSATAQAAQIRAWPLDTTFALSMGRSGDFPIGVVANTKLANSNDPASVSTDCNGGTVQNRAGINYGCLGFAAKPNNDGSCPVMKDANGQSVPTFRLRRYVALYPQIFDTNGDYLNEPQPLDTIYVADRPVNGPNGQTFMMKGPKPCPFAYFDKDNVTGLGKGYASTNSATWEGKNVDDIRLPDADTATSCSMALPILSPDRSAMAITTVNPLNTLPQYRRVYVRPIHAWAPHYEEDTDFKACAPLSNPLRDAPLHFAQLNNSTPVAWCAEAYPSQNDNVAALSGDGSLNPNYDGSVRTFSSHTVANSVSAACTATLPNIPAGYPGNGLSRHPGGTAVTCDRTVFTSTTLGTPRFPILAYASDVEQMLKNDPSYGCTISWDNNGGKTDKSSPTGNCCGTALTGLPAHLEPKGDGTTACTVPNY